MSIVYAAYVGIPAVTIAVNAALAYWIHTRHADVRGSRWFVASLAVSSLWMVLTVLTLVPVDDSVRRLARQFADRTAIWTFLTWVVFAAKYSHSDFHERTPVRVVLGVIVVISLLPTFVEPVGDLLYASVDTPSDPFPHVVIEPGPLFALTVILIGLAIVYALYELARYTLATPRRSALQLVALAIASFSVEIAIALGNFGVFRLEGASHGPYGVLPYTVLTALALFRFRLFDIQPVARNAVVENLDDPVVVLDGDAAIVDYNRATETVWPAIDDHLGQPVSMVSPELAAQLDDSDGTLGTGRRLSLAVDGDVRHYSLTVSTVGQGSGADSDLSAVLLRNVTDLAQSRWQLERQNERLEQVAATVSHDLRNPLSVADGYAEIVGETLADSEPSADDVAEARGFVGKVRDAHRRMEEIVADVLAIAREGKSVEETETLSLSAVAEEAWETVETGDATLSVTADRRIDADRSKLLTLFENLYRNAVEHVGEDVTVTVGTIPDGFFVADDGPGIGDEDAAEVFEYGYTTSEGGTGLGLSIVRTIAESHGWTVGLDEDADGSRFVFRDVSDASTTGRRTDRQTVAE